MHSKLSSLSVGLETKFYFYKILMELASNEKNKGQSINQPHGTINQENIYHSTDLSAVDC